MSACVCACVLLTEVDDDPDPGHSAKSAGGMLDVNMHTPLIQKIWSGLTMLLSRHNVGTYQKTNSQLIREHSVTVILAH